MKTHQALIALVFGLAFSLKAQDVNPIFHYMKNGPDYAAINIEISRNQYWYKYKNEKNRTPIKEAIAMKNGILIIYLLQKGAKVDEKTLSQGVKVFFGNDGNNFDFKDKSENTNKDNEKSVLLKNLIRGAKNCEDLLVEIAELLEFLSNDKIVIAKNINELFCAKEITERHIRLLLSSYEILFMATGIPTTQELYGIIKYLKPLNVPDLLLRFVVDVYMRKNESLKVCQELSLTGKYNDNVIKFATALIETSRIRFLKIPPSFWYEHTESNYNSNVNDAMMDLNALTDFVKHTLSSAHKNNEIWHERFYFWRSVLEILEEKGDFSSAFAVECALLLYSNEQTKKTDFKSKRHSLADDSKNYYNYRIRFSSNVDELKIPILPLHLRDLSSMREKPLWHEDKVNVEQIKIYRSFVREMLKAYKKAQKKSYKVDEKYMVLLTHLPLPHEDTVYINSAWQAAINLLWPTLPRRKNSIFS